MVVVGLGVFAGSSFVAAAGTTTSLDSCGYNPAAAPKPGGGTVIFDENTVTRTIAVYGVGSGAHVGVFANDESSLFVGTGGQAYKSAGTMTLAGTLTLNSTYTSISVTSNPALASGDTIVLKNASGTQNIKTSGAVAASAGTNSIPVVSFKAGKTFSPGDTATDGSASLAYGSAAPAALGTGTDAVGRFVAPSLYMTDITSGFSNTGDYEQGGTRVSPFTADGLFGGWSNVIGSKPPVSNNWNLGPAADTPPAGTTSFNEGYGTEVVWNVSSLTVGGQPLQAGHTYRVQSITHDDDQNHTSGGGDTGEVCTTIGIPGITTTATGDQIHPDGTANVSDSATVGGLSTPLPSGTSQVTFKVYGPDPTPGSNNADDCSGTPQTKNVALNSTTPNGVYPSGNFTVNAPGDYHFTADLTVGGVVVASSLCDAANETATVRSRPTSLTTDAGGPYAPPTSLSDTATLSGGTSNAGGTLTFTLYADNGGACATPALGSTQVTVNNGANGAQYTGTINAPANPGYFVPGTYHWSVSYSGDPATGNDASSDGVPCPATDTATNHENPVVLNPHIAISKTPDNQTIETGTTAGFTITVTNDGTVALTNVNVTDPLSPDCVRTATQTAPLIAAQGNNDSSFDPGESFNYTCSSPTLTSNLHNVATDHGTGGAKTVQASDDANVTVIHPDIDVLKNPPNQSVNLGGTANFTITVTNTGDTGLTNVTVTDAQSPNCALTAAQTLPKIQAVGNHDSTFDVGESFTYNCSKLNVQSPFLNIAQACGDDQLGTNVCDTSDNGGTPPPGCPEASRCASVGIDSMTSAQDFKPKDNATVTLTGGGNPLNGNVTFELFKGTCTTAHRIYSDTEAVDANGKASTVSASYLSALLDAKFPGSAPNDTAGTYNWQLTYSGDTNGNADIDGACGTENFTVTNG